MPAAPVAADARANAAAPDAACTAEAQRREQASRIPTGLLRAIALAESGRWDADSRRTRPWPWTVTAGGEGRFFATKAEAVAEVEILLSQGVTNVDVGCMQINMNHHWNAFETLETAFDPAANVAYAAGYLEKMRAATRSWEAAAGRYHSATPELAQRYRAKVLDHWRALRVAERHGGDGDAAEDADAARPDATADAARMAELNAAFRARREAGRADTDAASTASLRQQHLQRWREARSRQAGLEHLLALRQAELERKRRELLQQAERLDRETSFAERRRRQLDTWRLKVRRDDDG